MKSLAWRGRPLRLDREMAAELYREGLTDQAIADRTGCCKETVAVWRRSCGWKPNPPPAKPDISRLAQCARAARAAGMNYGQYMARQEAAERERRRRPNGRGEGEGEKKC